MNDFLSQYKNEVARLQNEYQTGISKLQEMARVYQNNLLQGNQQQPQPHQQPQPYQPNQATPQAAPQQDQNQFPHSIQLLAVLGDIKGLLMKLVPEEKTSPAKPESATIEAVPEQPVKQEDLNKKK